MIPHKSLQRLLTVSVLFLLAVRSHAEPILSVTFDDPNGAFAAFPDGISVLDMQNNPSLRESEIAMGIGGKARLKIDNTEWVEGSAEPPKSFQLLTDSAMGTKAFLRLVNDKQVPGTRGFTLITPSGIETALASLSQIEKGKVVLNGGLDLFFRYNEESASQQELVPNILSIGGDALHLTVESDAGSIIATISDDKNATLFDTDLDGTADAERVKTSFVQTAPIDPEAVYHLAVSFETADFGVVTLKVFLKQGNGAINTKDEADLVSKGSFSVITEDSTKTLQKGEIAIGAGSRTSGVKAILDLGAFRIFKPSPSTFPDIPEKE